MPLNKPITDWQGQRVWVIGASTGIGAAIARALLNRGSKVVLSARKRAALDELAASTASAQSLVCPLDVTKPDSITNAYQTILAAWQGVDVVLILAGTYQPMRAWDLDLERARAIIDVNLQGVLNVLSVVMHDMSRAGAGHIGIVASVAGYSGLPQALIYGPTKAALINLAEVLHIDLAPRGVGVHVINPGFVKTPLTEKNDFEMPALISAEEAAEQTLRGFERGEFETHYPKRFTLTLKFLRLLPYRWYFPLVKRITRL